MEQISCTTLYQGQRFVDNQRQIQILTAVDDRRQLGSQPLNLNIKSTRRPKLAGPPTRSTTRQIQSFPERSFNKSSTSCVHFTHDVGNGGSLCLQCEQSSITGENLAPYRTQGAALQTASSSRQSGGGAHEDFGSERVPSRTANFSQIRCSALTCLRHINQQK